MHKGQESGQPIGELRQVDTPWRQRSQERRARQPALPQHRRHAPPDRRRVRCRQQTHSRGAQHRYQRLLHNPRRQRACR